ncbi:MAG TPA: hypothetical protein VK154_14995 [Chitinophagales bacterium]|nr:hypothetical protein [Chitinophagales bacterium]
MIPGKKKVTPGKEKTGSNTQNDKKNPARNTKQDDEIETPSSKAIKLDEDIRNDIIQTEVNPHVKKRSPIQTESHAIDPEELNEDRRIVNEQGDDLGKNKYNSL